MEKNERTNGSAIDDLPEGHPVWLLMYASATVGALLAGGWCISRLITWLAADGAGAGVWATENVAVGAALLFTPPLVAMCLMQLVASRRRRRRNG